MVTETQTPTRTPIYEMSNEQLLFIFNDEMSPPWKRDIAREILQERMVELDEQISACVAAIEAYGLNRYGNSRKVE